MTALILDVCGTLFHGDTTIGLLTHHFTATGARSRLALIRASTARHSPLRLGIAVAERLSGRHLLKHRLIGLLRGVRVADLQASAESYADLLLREHKVGPVWTVIDRYPAATRRVLASASLEPVVAALAARLGADYVASELEARGGIYTGRLQRDLTGRKPAALHARFGPDLLAAQPVVISDNRSDAALLALAGKAYAVVHRARDRRRWPRQRVEFICA